MSCNGNCNQGRECGCRPADIVDRIADCLVEDHVALLRENRELRACIERTRNALRDLVSIINENKDGSFFICKEGAQIVETAIQEAS